MNEWKDFVVLWHKSYDSSKKKIYKKNHRLKYALSLFIVVYTKKTNSFTFRWTVCHKMQHQTSLWAESNNVMETSLCKLKTKCFAIKNEFNQIVGRCTAIKCVFYPCNQFDLFISFFATTVSSLSVNKEKKVKYG